ncbi:zinc finger protein 1 homolog [Planococcus citri]|uniref:zinc finger protein 1 homolog n=1 Tax=Planococcus citri TaxID=170843 RepID=UPI0031F977E1
MLICLIKKTSLTKFEAKLKSNLQEKKTYVLLVDMFQPTNFLVSRIMLIFDSSGRCFVIHLDKIKPYFRLCDGHFKPEDYRISMQRKVLMPASVPTLLPNRKHTLPPSINKSFQSGTDVTNFSKPTLNKNTSQNTICSSDFQRNTTTDAFNKRFCRNFKDITNHNIVPPKAAKLAMKKNPNLEKCRLQGKNFRSEIFRLKIRCSRLEDTVTNIRKEIKQKVEECFDTREKTAGNDTRDVQNLCSINAVSENSRHNFCNTEEATDQFSEDALAEFVEQVTNDDGYTTDSSIPPLEMLSNDLRDVETEPEQFFEEETPAEYVDEDNQSLNLTSSFSEKSNESCCNSEVQIQERSSEEDPVSNDLRNCFSQYEQTKMTDDELLSVLDDKIASGISASPQINSQLCGNNTAAAANSNNEQFDEAHVGQTLQMEQVLVTNQQSNRNDEQNVCQVRVELMRISPICDETFFDKSDSTRHQRKHSKPFPCPKCKKSFGTKQILKNHQTTHTERRPYKCGICDTKFKSNASKLRHELVHARGACFECAFCGKMYSYKYSLNDHLRTHSGEKSFHCQTCGTSFFTKSDFAAHQKTHNDRKNYKCRVCNRLFKYQGNKRAHERTHAEGSRYECALCGKKYSAKRCLANHISSNCS